MATIRVTPETLEQQGSELVNHAGDLSDILAKVDGKINEIIDGWDGLAQDAFYDLYVNMKESLDKFPEIVKSLGSAAQGAAKAFSQMDEELSNNFKG